MNMTRKLLTALLALALALTLVVAASAENQLLADIEKSGKIIVGTNATNAPWESIDESGAYVGYDMDLINEIASRMGVEVVIQDMAFDSLVAAVQTGKVNVAIASMGAKEERKQKDKYYQRNNRKIFPRADKKGKASRPKHCTP